MISQKAKNFFQGVTAQQVLILAALFAFILLFHARPVPDNDEYQYLLRLSKQANPELLANDWTYSTTGNEHWLFNQIFGFLARFLSIEFIGWAGRITSWILLLLFILRLGKFWRIEFPKIALSILLWLCLGQAVVGNEWMFGSFQAKVAAYVCLLAALTGFCKEKIISPAILLGLAFSFHPSVGFWSIPAVGAALLFAGMPLASLLKVALITGLFALPGVLPLLGSQINPGANSAEDWQFIALIRYPEYLDPFRFSKTTTFALFLMLAFNFLALRRSQDFALRFLLYFQLALCFVFIFGVGLRIFEKFELLRFMPFRLFPLFTPLFFIFTAFYLYQKLEAKRSKLLVAVSALLLIGWMNPVGKTYLQAEENYRLWANGPGDLQTTFKWLASATAADAIIVQPPLSRDTWYLSKRAQIASYSYPTYEHLGEWRSRIADLTGDLRISDSRFAPEEIDAAYNSLTPLQIEKIRAKYSATHLVSRAAYPYPVLFKTETYKVYDLNPDLSAIIENER